MDFPSLIPEEFRKEIYDFSDLFSKEEFKRFLLVDDYIFVCRKPGRKGDTA